jgi:aromatic-L-amino-acid/L-tryptophan decarboxylase
VSSDTPLNNPALDTKTPLSTAASSSLEQSTPQLGDMDAATFRAQGHRLVEWIADYLEHNTRYPVLAQVKPGEIASAFPAHAPDEGQPFDAILDDFERLLVPGLTHWNHPGFFAYFAISASAPGILADFLSSALNQQAMLWRTSPSATELEAVSLGWLRDLMGLSSAFDGVIYDTASISTLHALAAAREMKVPDVRTRGLAGRTDLPRLRIYCSEHAHSSVDKAVILLGLGHDAVQHIPADDQFRLSVDALDAAIQRDLADGLLPIAVVATVGSTSTTSVDPVPAIADVCDRYDLWLHIDAAYGGVAATVPDRRHILDGCDRAHSLVVNPHKWLFVPFDLSALYCRRMDLLRAAFTLTPDFLKTPEAGVAQNLMDTGIQLGRRFRALKLWMVLRYFGADGIRRRLAEHMRLARLFASWVDADPYFERIAPVPFSVVCFRAKHSDPHATGVAIDAFNDALMARVNATGEIYLSHTRLHDRLTLRLAIGHLRTTETHVARAWTLLKLHAAYLDGRAVPTEVQ